MNNYYTRLILVILIVIAIAQFAPREMNMFLVLVIASMLIMNSKQFAALIAKLKL